MIKVAAHEDHYDLEVNLVPCVLLVAAACGWYFLGVPDAALLAVRWSHVSVGLLAGAVIFLCIQGVAAFVPQRHLRAMEAEQALVQGGRREWPLPARLGSGIMAGVAEEAFVRGVAQPVLTALVGLPLALLATNIAFGLAHSIRHWKVALATGLIGVVFGLLLVATGSLLVVIIAHATCNVLTEVGE